MGRLILKNEHGFSIVELLVVLLILSIVITISYMFFGFGLQSFDRGEQKAIAQQGIRLAANFISHEIRYANNITINPASVDNDDYNYIYQQGNTVYYQDKDKNIPARILLDSAVDELNYSISLSEDSSTAGAADSLVVTYLLSAYDNGNEVYSLETNVFILNFGLNSVLDINDLEGGNLSGIKYSKPLD